MGLSPPPRPPPPMQPAARHIRDLYSALKIGQEGTHHLGVADTRVISIRMYNVLNFKKNWLKPSKPISAVLTRGSGFSVVLYTV